MITPSETLEQALAAHGDTLYRMALLLGGDDRRAEALLRAAVTDLLAAGLAAPPDEPALLARLVAAARREEARRRRPAPRPPNSLPPLYRSVLTLPLDQRLALGLALLAGYDMARAAQTAGQDEPTARAALIDAVRTLAPAAGHSLTDRVSGETCDDVRAALIDPAGRQRHSAAVRGHLASCGACRSFDHSWGEVCAAAEAAMRAVLRERTLPAALAARLVALARPARQALSPNLRFVLPPLAVLGLIAALVLPGFSRRSITVVDPETAPPSDPRALVAKALDSHIRPPQSSAPVWHGRYETLWYFNEQTVAPLHADIWLDRTDPARHRLQITHAAGGAPYELQLGDGKDLLHYALDAAYVPALYGEIRLPARTDQPLLLSMRSEPHEQEQALSERLHSGPWSIPPFYLRQAEQAQDLRMLGRLNEGGRSVQVLSFSGVSPLGIPADAPGATAERVTVMLALDSTDGRLRSATEISGPPGGTQISRVTWRLIEEQNLSGGQAGPVFSIERAWNGLGEFPSNVRHVPVDLATPALALQRSADPARVIGDWRTQLWMPAAPPPGVERAILLWPEQQIRSGNLPDGLIYLGPGRRLAITYDGVRQTPGEPEQVGPWSVWLSPGRGHSYYVTLRRTRSDERPGVPFVRVNMFARGFSRDELLDLVKGFDPLDLDGLAAHEGLFDRGAADPAARAALIELLRAEIAAGEEGMVHYVRSEQYNRQSNAFVALDDPYHRPLNDGLPERYIVESWSKPGPDAQLYSRQLDLDGNLITSTHQADGEIRQFYAPASYLAIFDSEPVTLYSGLSGGGRSALNVLARSREGLSMQNHPDGRRVLRLSENAATSPTYGWALDAPNGRPYMADVRPITLTTEIELDADGALASFRLIGEDIEGRTTELLSDRVLERAILPLAEAPPALHGELPKASFTRNWRNITTVHVELHTVTLSETLELAETPIYLLPEDEQFVLQKIEVGIPNTLFRNTVAEDFTGDMVGAGLGYRFVYLLEPDVDPRLSDQLRLTQGPAGPMRAFLASDYTRPWFQSFQERISVAGTEQEVWIARGSDFGYVFVELGETLLIAEAPIGWFDENIGAALAGLRPAE